MRVLVCGGRTYYHKDYAFSVLNKHLNQFYVWTDTDDGMGCWFWDLVIIEGGARGADQLAREWAALNYVETETYLADWDTYGKAAGYIRNKTMLEDGKPDLVIAFPGGRGTAMMKKIAREAGVEVIEVE